MKVLFIGNSYTHCNAMPDAVRTFAESAGMAFSFEMSAPGGMTFAWHWDEGGAREKIAAGGWDAVVLQEQSMRPIEDPDAMHVYARKLAGEIENIGARTVFYMTWARRGKPGTQDSLARAYTSIADELAAECAPVGLAWRFALADRPDLVLHTEDDSHPRLNGSYLAASVLYATLTGKPVEGLPSKFVARDETVLELPADEAAYLRRVAADTVSAFEKRAAPQASRPGTVPNRRHR